MKFKNITSIVLSTLILGTTIHPQAAGDAKKSIAVAKTYQPNKSKQEPEKVSIFKDPICLSILAGGAACLGYSLYKNYEDGTSIQGTGLHLPADFMGFEWLPFSLSCISFRVLYNNDLIRTDIPEEIRYFYDEHIEPYMRDSGLNIREFQLHVLNNRISCRQLDMWRRDVGMFLTTRIFDTRTGIRRPTAANNHPELNGFDFTRFSNILSTCLAMGPETRNRYLLPDINAFYQQLYNSLDIRRFLLNESEQRHMLLSYIRRTGSSVQNLNNWMNDAAENIHGIPTLPPISDNKQGYRSRFGHGLREINFAPQSSQNQLHFKVNDQFLNCNQNIGWRATPLDDQDKNQNVIKRRIDTIFGADRLPNAGKSFCKYVFGHSIYDARSRFVTLQGNDPGKIELFARILKALSRLEKNTINNNFKPIVNDIRGQCSNELSQCIDNLALTLDQVSPGSNSSPEFSTVLESAITAAKRTALKQAANRAVEDHCDADIVTAEWQKNLYALLAPIFNLNDGMHFHSNAYNGENFVKYLQSTLPSDFFASLCDHFFKDCFDAIGANITNYLSGLSSVQSESIYNTMGSVRISYNDFKRILSSCHTSNKIELRKNTFLRSAPSDDFETRFNKFIGSLGEEDADVKTLCEKWKNGTARPKFKEIVDKIIESSALNEEATKVYELNMYNEFHNTPAGKAWMGDILTYVYLHCQGIVRAE